MQRHHSWRDLEPADVAESCGRTEPDTCACDCGWTAGGAACGSDDGSCGWRTCRATWGAPARSWRSVRVSC